MSQIALGGSRRTGASIRVVLLCSQQQGTNLDPEMGLISGHLPEIVILLVVVLIIWGPGKLPDIGAAIGRGISEFRKASSESHDTAPSTTSTATPAQPALTQASNSVVMGSGDEVPGPRF